MRTRLALTAAGAAGSLVLLSACGGGEANSDTAGLDNAVISTYGTGTSTYNEMAAVADKLTADAGINVRIITSDTGIGRMTPIHEGQAQFGRTGDEYVYAFEAEHEFAAEDWGPQPVRVAWAPPIIAGMLVKSDSAISSLADLKGKNFPNVTANPSVNSKLTALLEGAGLTQDDVNMVDVSYGDQPDALKTGSIDVMFMSTEASSISELEAAGDVEWIDLDPENADLTAAFEEHAPTVWIDEFESSAGQADGQPDHGMYYPVPIVTYAETTDEDVYELTKAITDTYSSYEDTINTMHLWSTENVAVEPSAVPYHPGTIAFLEEEGLWTEDAQAAQDELLEREEQLMAGWEEVSGSGGDIPAEWEQWKSGNL